MIKEAEKEFEKGYKNLNPLQKEAVDTTEGPVMVVAGPGTGKTQILALRIGNILKKTDTKADSVLCLTFTNSGVKAMKERLRRYIGAEASHVKVAAFHSFGLEILEKFYGVLGLDSMPKLMDEKEVIALCDEILENNSWQYIKPRSDTARYFRDLKSLISILKREGLKPKDFEREVKNEIKSLQEDENNISSRGESKGSLKKEVVKKIEGLERTLEAVKFYEIYEEKKKEENLFDFNDILESLVDIVKEDDDARGFLKEEFQYILVDEHQDSSGIQNKFLEVVWGEEEKPNIFVVGDDRQLIYGFGGASLEYFKNFKHTFGKAHLITLIENYRSTQSILDGAHDLLESSLSPGKLKSNIKENHKLSLVEAYYPRDEIIYAGIKIKDLIEKGGNPNEMAILVPKNREVESTITILKNLGIKVASNLQLDFFTSAEALFLIQVLRVVANPSDGAALASTFFNKLSGIPPIKAHLFFKEQEMRKFSLLDYKPEKNNLFENNNEVNIWLNTLKDLVNISNEPLYTVLQKVGDQILLKSARNHEELMARIEVVRTILHLSIFEIERGKPTRLRDFLAFVDRITKYGEGIPLLNFMPEDGVKVMTLHGSKGLEFDFVWIAHMSEKSFGSQKALGFSLPSSLEDRMEERGADALKRELYVAMTRAKRFCTISYLLNSHTGRAEELASVASDIAHNFTKVEAGEVEKEIIDKDVKAFASLESGGGAGFDLEDLKKLVARDFKDRKVSVSLLNNFFECPWKWYFRNLLQLPEPKGPSLAFGNIVHGAIDQVLKSKKVPTKKELEKIIEKEVAKSAMEDERLEKDFYNSALLLISAWVEKRFNQISKKHETEKSISVNDPRFKDLVIYGKCDLVESIGDEDPSNDTKDVRVVDFKTGNPRKKSEIEKLDEEGRPSDYMRQLVMYTYLIDGSYKGMTSVGECVHEFLEAKDGSDAFYKIKVTEDMVEMLVKDIKDYEILVESGAWVSRPCNFKSYGRAGGGECEYCKLAKIY